MGREGHTAMLLLTGDRCQACMAEHGLRAAMCCSMRCILKFVEYCDMLSGTIMVLSAHASGDAYSDLLQSQTPTA